MKLHPVHRGCESTALSIYDTCPESPDGRYLCYVLYTQVAAGRFGAERVEARVMVKDRQGGAVREIAVVRADNHNGVNATWTK